MTNKPWWREPSRKQWAAFAAAWVGWVLDAFDFTIYIVVTREMSREFGVSAVAIGGSLTLTLLVRLAGGCIAGWMADRWGRKLPLMLSLIWFAVFDAAIYFAPTFTWVLVCRTLFGFGMGAEWTAGTSLAMESFPPRGRRFASGMLQAGWPVGFLLAAGLAMFVVPAFGWRAMFLIAAVPALLVIPIRMLVSDELAGKPAKAILEANAFASDSRGAPPSHSRGAPASHSRGALADLATPGVPLMIVLGSLVMALGFIVYYGMVTTYPAIHAEHGASPALWRDLVWFNIGMLVGVVAAGWVANRFGVIAALVAPALLMVPALPLYIGAVPTLMPLGAFLGGALGVGYSGVTPVLTTSLFPDHVRARAIGIVYHAGALIAAFVPTLIPWLATRARMSVSTTMMLVVGAGLVAMAAAVIMLRSHLTNPRHERSRPRDAALAYDHAA